MICSTTESLIIPDKIKITNVNNSMNLIIFGSVEYVIKL